MDGIGDGARPRGPASSLPKVASDSDVDTLPFVSLLARQGMGLVLLLLPLLLRASSEWSSAQAEAWMAVRSRGETPTFKPPMSPALWLSLVLLLKLLLLPLPSLVLL